MELADTSQTSPVSAGPTIGKVDATLVGGVSIYSAAAGMVFMVISARVLSPGQNAQFMLFWSVIFWVFGCFLGLQNETTRSVRAGRSGLVAAEQARRVPVLPVGAAIGVGGAIVIALTGLWWAPHVFDDPWVAVAVLVVAAACYGAFSALAGILSGMGRWRQYSLQVALDCSLRLAGALLCALLAAGIVGFEVAASLGVFAWGLVLVLSRVARQNSGVRGDVPTRRFLRNSLQAMVATAASSVLLVGFTILMRATTPAGIYAGAAPLILAISVTRAPLMIPLNSYQGVVISHFAGAPSQGWATLRRALGVVVVLGVAVAGLAWWIGPAVMAFVFGADYRLPGGVIAGLALAAVSMAAITLVGAICLSIGRHGWYLAGWLVATAVSVGLLLLPLDLDTRVVVSLAAGPIVGACVHTFAIWTGRREPQGG